MGESAWFFAPPGAWHGARVELPADEAHHALRVRRVRPLDEVTLTDGVGTVARCRLVEAAGDAVVAEVIEASSAPRPRPEVVVYQGAAKGSKCDEVVERLAEIGVAEVRVFESARSVVRWDAPKRARLARRWAAIARSAAKQSRSPYLTVTGPPLPFSELRARLRREPLAAVLWEEAELPLRVALDAPAERVALVVGPEGGLERPEAEALADAGALLVSLGPRILRTENAALVAASAVMYHHGLIG